MPINSPTTECDHHGKYCRFLRQYDKYICRATCQKKAVDVQIPGLNKVVSGAGILFPVGDEKKLAEEILHLSNDSGHYAATAQRCLVRAKNYDISKMVAAHINLYKEILKIQ